ncbi:MAG: response regulator transcription factor [Bacteroidota bacterium]
MKIMIVDDNKRMREVIKSLLSSSKNKIVECTDGSEAVREFGQSRPDWVVMDIGMKELDGISAVREICSAFPKAKIVILTDYGDPFFRREAQEAGACGFVLKENLHDVISIINH